MREWSKTVAGRVTSGVAVFAAGAAITAGLVTGGFDSPPPACYISAPTAGATLTGAATLTATCGTSTVSTQFLLDGVTTLVTDNAAPFTSSWDSTLAANGTHTLTAFLCDVTDTCVQANSVSITISNVPAAPVNASPPVANGAASIQVGSTVACSTGTWNGDVSSGYTYQWKDGAGNISGATSSTYLVASGEMGAFIYCHVTATGTGGSTSADSNTLGPVQAASGLTTSNLWVSTSGSSACTRNAVPVNYATAVSSGNVCATGPQAYVKAHYGDNVLIETSTFTTEWTFTKTMVAVGSPTVGTCNYNYISSYSPITYGTPSLSSCVTFEPASGQTFTFNVGGSTGQVSICASYLAFLNVTFTQTLYNDVSPYFGQTSNQAVGVGSSSNTCGTTAPHDILFQNATFGGAVAFVGGVYNAWVVNSLALSVQNIPWQWGGIGNNGGTPASHDFGIVGTTFDGFNFVANNGRHMECVHFNNSMNHFVLAHSRVLNCPIESMFWEMDSGKTSDRILIENNYIDSGAVFKITCHSGACTISNFTIRFNTVSGVSFNVQEECGTCTGAVVTGNVMYGNLGNVCPSYTAIGGTTGTGWASHDNVVAGASGGICAGGSNNTFSATISLASAGSPNYNDDLSGTNTATNYVAAAVTGGWPPDNIYGTTRSGATTNAGAN